MAGYRNRSRLDIKGIFSAMRTNANKIPQGGELTIDPTENVKALQEANTQHLTSKVIDLEKYLMSEVRHIQSQVNHVKELSDVKSSHLKEVAAILEHSNNELQKNFKEHLATVRSIDAGYVKTEADRVLVAVQLLAKSTSDGAATLAKQTADTIDGVQKSIRALELAKSEGLGKSSYADPQMAELLREIKEERGTKKEGISSVWLAVLGVLSAIGTISGVIAVVMVLIK